MVYRGLGNEWREQSQLCLMKRLRDEYGIRTVLNAPYDHATDPEIDNAPFEKWRAWKDFPVLRIQSDLVWNFDFVQRQPYMLHVMKYFSRKYVLAFVPNRYNAGQMIHGFYHKLHGNVCSHPEGGDFSLMTRAGLEHLFESNNLTVVESGGIDSPMWPDWVVSLANFLRTPDNSNPLSIYDNTPHLPMPKQLLAFEQLVKPIDFAQAHHCYCLGEKIDG